jgi:hypothetical protein
MDEIGLFINWLKNKKIKLKYSCENEVIFGVFNYQKGIFFQNFYFWIPLKLKNRFLAL